MKRYSIYCTLWILQILIPGEGTETYGVFALFNYNSALPNERFDNLGINANFDYYSVGDKGTYVMSCELYIYIYIYIFSCGEYSSP